MLHQGATSPIMDLEKATNRSLAAMSGQEAPELPPLKGLSLLDRFLVVWIILAMAVGILLGNFVPSAATTLQRGEFVGVSVPIGALLFRHFVSASKSLPY